MRFFPPPVPAADLLVMVVVAHRIHVAEDRERWPVAILRVFVNKGRQRQQFPAASFLIMLGSGFPRNCGS